MSAARAVVTGGPSLWEDQLDDPAPRAPLAGSTEADVCIIGAGFTGLWTAYYLLTHDPALRIVIVEARTVGFGASGRNGGWCSALFPASVSALARAHGRDAALALRRAMNASVSTIGAVASASGIDCDFRLGGTVRLARTPVQLGRARAEAEEDAAFDGIDGVTLLDAAQAREHVRATDVLGGTFIANCARIQPARLVRGLADVVERLGGVIAEGTRALRTEDADGARPGRGGPRVITDQGIVTARYVVRAVEAWTSTLPDSRRDLVPVYSLMVATEPLPADFWNAAGLAGAQTFSDHRNLIVYGQRTADDRIVFGGRGAPYHFGSRIAPRFDHDPAVFAGLHRAVTELFPRLRDHAFTHAWGGPLGITRDWRPSVDLDRRTGIARAGGYVGDGVGTSHLAGATLADLILGRDSDLVRLPWVGHRSPRWEPEPLRWLGVNAGLRAMTAADLEERVTRRPSVTARALAPYLGH